MISLRQNEILLQPETKQLFVTHFALKAVPNHHLYYSLYNFMLSSDSRLLFNQKLIATCKKDYMLLGPNSIGNNNPHFNMHRK